MSTRVVPIRRRGDGQPVTLNNLHLGQRGALRLLWAHGSTTSRRACLGACAAVALLGCGREERRLDPSSPSATPDFPDERPRIYEANAPAMSGCGTCPPILADLEWS